MMPTTLSECTTWADRIMIHHTLCRLGRAAFESHLQQVMFRANNPFTMVVPDDAYEFVAVSPVMSTGSPGRDVLEWLAVHAPTYRLNGGIVAFDSEAEAFEFKMRWM